MSGQETQEREKYNYETFEEVLEELKDKDYDKYSRVREDIPVEYETRPDIETGNIKSV